MLNETEQHCHVFGEYWDKKTQQCVNNQYEVAICNDYFALPSGKKKTPIMASQKYRDDPVKKFTARCTSLGTFPTYTAAKKRLFEYSNYDGIWCEPKPALDTPCMAKITDKLSGDIAFLAPHEVAHDQEPQYDSIDESDLIKTQTIMGRLFF